MEIKTGMVFAPETSCMAQNGFSAAWIAKDVVAAKCGRKVISPFPAKDLPVTGRS